MLEYSYLVKKVRFDVEIIPCVKIVSATFVHLFFICFTFFVYALLGARLTLCALQSGYDVRSGRQNTEAESAVLHSVRLQRLLREPGRFLGSSETERVFLDMYAARLDHWLQDVCVLKAAFCG